LGGVDLALSLAMGVDWLGFKVPQPVRVALITREDNPSLTAWRMKHLYLGSFLSAFQHKSARFSHNES